jgi:hypothetical protein
MLKDKGKRVEDKYRNDELIEIDKNGEKNECCDIGSW